jgi:hypothetical protein
MVTFPHTVVQFYANEYAIHNGHAALYRLATLFVLTVAAVFSALVFPHVVRQPQSKLVLSLWCLTLLLIVGSWSAFTGNNTELVHYPQYFPEGVLLMALTLSPVDALTWVVVFGGLDEAYQFWCLPRSRVSLYDFNDIFMDLLGGAAGVVFAIGFLQATRRQKSDMRLDLRRQPGLMAIGTLISLGVILWALGLMLLVNDKSNHHYWFALGDFRAPSFWAHVLENGPKHYHTLTPIEGCVLILMTIGIYAWLTRKYAFTAAKQPN